MVKPLGAHRPLNASLISVLGKDTQIAGNIEASNDLQVEGRVEGDIACQSLTQGDNSEIVGAVRAESVRIAGVVRGSITARDVTILKSAQIEGDVSYAALTIEQGARLDGRLSPRGSQGAPQLPRAIEAEPALSLAPPVQAAAQAR